MERKEIQKILEDDATSMDVLRQVGRLLEPVVGREVRAVSKEDLRDAIGDALDEAADANQYQAATNAIAETLGFASIESLDEVEAKLELASSSDDDSDDSDDSDDDSDEEPRGSADVEKIIWVRSNPIRMNAYLNDVVINPKGEILAMSHTVVDAARARELIETIGRLNTQYSRTPDLGVEDLR